MSINNTAETVLGILRSYIKNEKLNLDLNEEQIKNLFLVMKAHNMLHLPGLVIENANSSPKYEMFQRAQFLAALMFEQQQYERNRISETLENNQIKFVHLKGPVIAKYYHEPWHRSSCDIDILLNNEDIQKSAALLTERLGYTLRSNMTNHDVSLFLDQNIHVELHYDLSNTEITLSDAWNSATPAQGKSYEYVFTPEIIMLYHYAHMAKHFKNCGCGIKAVLDLYFLEHNLEYDKEILDNLLIKGGIKTFAESILYLTEVWFSGAESNEITDVLTEFIINSGAYGSIKHLVPILIQKSNAGRENISQRKYVLSRIFLPYENLKYIYPVLQKHKFLIPLYQVKRWLSFLSPKRFARVRNEVRTYVKMDKEKSQKVVDMLKELELL